MAQQTRIGDDIVGATHGAVSQNLDSVEAGVDEAIDQTKEAVHELRNEAQEVVDRTLRRVKRSWEQRRPYVEEYVASHPWIVLGAALLFAYFIVGGGSQPSRKRSGWSG